MTQITKEAIEAAKSAYWHEAHNGGGYSDKCYEAALTAALPFLSSPGKDGGQEVEAVGEAAELARLRAIALDMQAGYVEATERAEEAVKAANALQTEVDLLRSTIDEPASTALGSLPARKMSINQINSEIAALEEELRRRDGTRKPDEHPLSFFMENVDRWGAAEWFDRMAKAIRKQDEAVVAMYRSSEDDKVLHEADFESCRNIAASSAMHLVRDHEQEVRSALSASTSREGESE